MIVCDTSALVAIVLGEPDAERYRDALLEGDVGISAVSVTEARLVIESRGGLDALGDLDQLISGVDATVLPYAAEHAAEAHRCWQRFGKGRHPAGLNFGDCIAYATARVAEAPLLFKGDDFTQSDISSVL